MYIYYITRYYTKISLSTLQYYTMYCKNTKYTVYPRLFRCSCWLLSIWPALQFKIEFSGGFTRPLVTTWGKRTKDCHQWLESVWPLFAGFGGNFKEFYFIFFLFFQLENERLGNWHFIRRAMKNI